MKNKKFIVNAIIMVIASFLLRFCGMWFRVYLADKIGASGMGLYQLIFSVFTAGVAMSTSGMFLVSVRLVSENSGKGAKSAIRSSLAKCIGYGVILSIIAAFLLLIFADKIAKSLLCDPACANPLRILSFGLPFMACCACLRGYFVAQRNTLQPSIAEIAEQIITVLVPVITMKNLSDLPSAINMIMLGSTLGEVTSCLYMYIAYRIDITKKGLKMEKSEKMLSTIVRIAFPSTVASTARNLLGTAENLLIPFGLKKSGISPQLSLERYGTLQGMAFPALIFPSAVIFPFSSLLVPEISRARAKDDNRAINDYIAFALHFSLYFSIFVACLFFEYAHDLSISLYKSPEGGDYMRILAPIIPLLYTDNVVDGILKGLDKQLSSCKYNLIDGFSRIVLILILLPKYRMAGYIFILFFSALLNGFLSFAKLIRTASFHFPVLDYVIFPLFLSIFCIFIAEILPLSYILRIVISSIIYLSVVLIKNAVTKSSPRKTVSYSESTF